MLRTHEYVITALVKQTMCLLSEDTHGARLFLLNGCNYYMCWLSDNQIGFGSGRIEITIPKGSDEQEVKRLFTEFIDPYYSNRIEYGYETKVKTIEKLKDVAPWFTMWASEE